MPCSEERGRKRGWANGTQEAATRKPCFLSVLPPSLCAALSHLLWEFSGELVTRCCFQAGTGNGELGKPHPGLLGWTITEGRWDTGAGNKGAILGEGRGWAQHRVWGAEQLTFLHRPWNRSAWNA